MLFPLVLYTMILSKSFLAVPIPSNVTILHFDKSSDYIAIFYLYPTKFHKLHSDLSFSLALLLPVPDLSPGDIFFARALYAI